MSIFRIKKIKPLLKLTKSEYKYLSPFIYKYHNYFKLYYCNRKNNKFFFGQINSAKSTNLKTWIKDKNILFKPNTNVHKSYISPNLIYIKNKYYFFLEAQNNNSDILCFKSKNDYKFNKKCITLLSKKNNTYQSPFSIIINDNIYLYYSHNKKYINCLILNKNLSKLKKYNCLISNKKNEKYSIYSPSIIFFENKYYMFYAAWQNINKGNINLAVSQDGIKWKKIYQNLFSFPKVVSIISEPYVMIYNKKLLVFYEFKQNSIWNIGKMEIKIKDFKKEIYK